MAPNKVRQLIGQFGERMGKPLTLETGAIRFQDIDDDTWQIEGQDDGEVILLQVKLNPSQHQLWRLQDMATCMVINGQIELMRGSWLCSDASGNALYLCMLLSVELIDEVQFESAILNMIDVKRTLIKTYS